MEKTVNIRELDLEPGQSRHVDSVVHIDPYRQGGQAYVPESPDVAARLDVDAMLQGHVFRLRFTSTMEGPCSRCLEPAQVRFEIDSREVHDQRSADPELLSDFVEGDELHLDAWAQDSVGLSFPWRVLCRDDCAGLCPVCGTNRNEAECACDNTVADSRWEKLRELKLEE